MRRSTAQSPGSKKSALHSSTPAPARLSPRAMPPSSASPALRLGVGRPSAALCLWVREVEKPRAPAAMASAVNRPISSISAAVGAAAWSAPRSPITKARRAPWGICAPTSTARGTAARASKVLGEGLPGEVEAGGEHGLGDVLDAFHQVDEQTLSAARHRARSRPRSCP